jgi:coenzyme F420-0:L-glutamate ligase/coenzyme F420-1:gamma-L-glutamate ligase
MPLTLTPLKAMPLIAAGDDLADIITSALVANDLRLQDGDILVLGQKIVSKAEGRTVNWSRLPQAPAVESPGRPKDARLIELILRESRRVVRTRPGTIIVEHNLGFVCANAGIDHSNVAPPGTAHEELVLLLPVDPDQSAASIRKELEVRFGKRLGVLINDSHGRAWRLGTVGTCIGTSGVPPLVDERGWEDLFGYRLQSTLVGVADELAAAASLIMGQAAEGTPVVHARDFPIPCAKDRCARCCARLSRTCSADSPPMPHRARKSRSHSPASKLD